MYIIYKIIRLILMNKKPYVRISYVPFSCDTNIKRFDSAINCY